MLLSTKELYTNLITIWKGYMMMKYELVQVEGKKVAGIRTNRSDFIRKVCKVHDSRPSAASGGRVLDEALVHEFR
jgi:hypothetical protein